MADPEGKPERPTPPRFSTLESYGQGHGRTSRSDSADDSEDDFDPHEELGPKHLVYLGPVFAVVIWVEIERSCADWFGFALIMAGFGASLGLGRWRKPAVMRGWALVGLGLAAFGWLIGIPAMMWSGLVVLPVAGALVALTTGLGRR